MPATSEIPGIPAEKRLLYTNWGRSAVETALRAEGLEGTHIMLPAFMCQGSFEHMFRRLDLTPVFVDIDPETYHIDLELAKSAADRVDAVLLVHPYGLPADMDAWVEFCADEGLVLIEDCARAWGAEYDDRPVGSFGSQAIYSLHKVSPVSIGGAVATTDEDAEASLDQPRYDAYALYHALPDDAKSALSTNYPRDYECRMLDGITRQQFEQFLDRRYDAYRRDCREKAHQLREALEPLGFEFQADAEGRTHYLVSAMVPESVDRDELLDFLLANSPKPPVKVVWANPWAKSYHPDRYDDEFPNSRRLGDRIICFTARNMDDNHVSIIEERTRKFMRAYARTP